jgi:DNA-binding beta-propeller fold protein YncE
MKKFSRTVALVLLVIVGACSTSRQALTQHDLARGVPEVPGARSDGSVMLPNQWSLRPVGRQIALGDFPVNLAVSPNGHFAAVLHSGDSDNEIIVVDLKTNGVGIISRAVVEESFYGLAFSSDGKQLFCSGAGDEVVHQFAFADGYLSEHREIHLRDKKQRSIPSGLALSRDGKNLFVANLFGHRVSYVDLEQRGASVPRGN